MVATLKSWTSFVRALNTTSQVAQYQEIFFDNVDSKRLAGWEHAASCDGNSVSSTPGAGGDLFTSRTAAATGSPTSSTPGAVRYRTSNTTGNNNKAWWIGRRARSHDLSVDPGSDPYTYCMVAVADVDQSATNPTGQILFGRRYTAWTLGTTTALPSVSTPTAQGITQTFIPWTVSGPMSAYNFCTYTPNGTMLFMPRQSGTYTTAHTWYYYGNEIGVRGTVDDGTGPYRTYEFTGTITGLFTAGSPTSISSNISGAFSTNVVGVTLPGSNVNTWAGGAPGRDEATNEWILSPIYVTGSSSTRQRRYGIISDFRESHGTNFAEVVDGDTDPVRLVHINRSTSGTSGGIWVPVTSSVVAAMT